MTHQPSDPTQPLPPFSQQPPMPPRPGLWRRFRGWPTGAQTVVWVVLGLIVLGAISGESDTRRRAETTSASATTSLPSAALTVPFTVSTSTASTVQLTVPPTAPLATLAPRVRPVITVPPVTAAPVLPMGAVSSFPDGSTAQFFSFRSGLTSTNQFVTPDPGNTFAAIDVQVCAGASDEMAGPSNFILLFPDNTRRDPAFAPVGVAEPLFGSLTQIPAGTCARGNVVYEVPLGASPSGVQYSSTDGRARWTI